MSISYNQDILTWVADEMATEPAYIEKDYFIVRVLQGLSSFKSLGKELTFSGGTSLSKGYKFIQRFSEDIDFKIHNAGTLTKLDRKQIRHEFVKAVSKIEDIKIVKDFAENEGKKHTVLVSYPHLLPLFDSLREYLRIELVFEPLNLSTEIKTINSFIAEFSEENQENVQMQCNHPFNIMADKFNAITWRIFASMDDFDYTLMRHLHDLYAISVHIGADIAFKKRVLENFETKDKFRVPNVPFKELLSKTNEKLLTNPKYRTGYEQFVDAMSYAPDRERITFDMALTKFQELSRLFGQL